MQLWCIDMKFLDAISTLYCSYRIFYLWKFVMYLLEPDCVLVGKSIMCIITPNSIPNVHNASPFWILSNMIMSMQIYILQKAIHTLRIKEISRRFFKQSRV